MKTATLSPEGISPDGNQMLELLIPGLPLPWKAPYVGTRGAFSPRTAVKEDFRKILRKQYNEPLIDYQIAVEFIFIVPIPVYTSQKKRILMLSGEIRPIKRPDRGNFLKLYEDSLTGIVITDDSIIVDGPVRKFYGLEPKTVIKIYTLTEYSSYRPYHVG